MANMAENMESVNGSEFSLAKLFSSPYPYDAHSQVAREEFTVVENGRRARKRRKNKGDSSQSDHRDSTSNDENESQAQYVKAPKVVVITSDMANLAKISPVKIAKALNDISQNMVSKVNKTKNGIAVHCYTAALAAKLKKVTTLGPWSVKVEYPLSETQSKGVIYGIDQEISEDEIKQALKSEGVVDAKRLKRKVDGKLTDSLSICLTFNSKVLPQQICIGYEIYQIKPYVAPVIRCFKCQGLGHKANVCKGKTKCVRCGEMHSYDDCPVKTNPKCCRCGEQHSAAYEGCSTIKTAKKVQVVKAKNNIPYSEAVKIVKETTYLKPVYFDNPVASQNSVNHNSTEVEEHAPSFVQPTVAKVNKTTVPKKYIQKADASTQTKVTIATQTETCVHGDDVPGTSSVPLYKQIVYLVSAVLDIHKKTNNEKEKDSAIEQLLEKHTRAIEQYKQSSQSKMSHSGPVRSRSTSHCSQRVDNNNT